MEPESSDITDNTSSYSSSDDESELEDQFLVLESERQKILRKLHKFELKRKENKRKEKLKKTKNKEMSPKT